MAKRKPLVAVIMGSESDWPVMQECVKTLGMLDVPCEARVLSAHRIPQEAARFAAGAERAGLRVIIAAAGGAAHLAGAIAAHTLLPVIGVPLQGWALDGLDALLSTVQMPGGVPVATMAIGKAGARNAAFLAGAILGLSDGKLMARLKTLRRKAARAVAASDRRVRAEAQSLGTADRREGP